MALEIVGADRPAELRPSALAPIIHQALAAHDRLEALRLAHRRIGGMPEKRDVARASASFFIGLQRTFGRADIEIDETGIPESGQVFYQGDRLRSRTNELHHDGPNILP